MGSETGIGRVVWHDLLTGDVDGAMWFYAGVLGWRYRVEHARDFVWRAGAADYPLILSGGEAHGGFVDPGPDGPFGWLAYVTVSDVDAAAERAGALGASVPRAPFDVPGVGRVAVLRDPRGAAVCVVKPSHGYPPPSGTFLADGLATDEPDAAAAFYVALFGREIGDGAMAPALRRPDGTAAPDVWVPQLATDDPPAAVARAAALGARVLPGSEAQPGEPRGHARSTILRDPTGAVFGLAAAPATSP